MWYNLMTAVMLSFAWPPLVSYMLLPSIDLANVYVLSSILTELETF